MKTRNDIIQNIKDCGQSLIDNAEKIVEGLPKYTFVDLTLTCYVANTNEAVRINVDYDFSPEKFIERLKSYEDSDDGNGSYENNSSYENNGSYEDTGEDADEDSGSGSATDA